MALTDLMGFVSKAIPKAYRDSVSSFRQRDELQDVSDYLGRGVGPSDERTAVLVIREAPRIGARVGAGTTLRRYLESIEAVSRVPTGRIIFATDDFIVEDMQESDAERYSIAYNFGSPVVQTSSGSGRNPRFYSYQGSFLSNRTEGSSSVRFSEAWEKYLRGSANVNGEFRADIPYVAELIYRDQIRRGYLTALTRQRTSEFDTYTSFNLEMFVIHQASFTVSRQRSVFFGSEFSRSVVDRTSDGDIDDFRADSPLTGVFE